MVSTFNASYNYDYSISLVLVHVSNRTPEEVLAAKGVKPTLSPNLNTLALVEVFPVTSLSMPLRSFSAWLVNIVIVFLFTGCWCEATSVLWCWLPSTRFDCNYALHLPLPDFLFFMTCTLS